MGSNEGENDALSFEPDDVLYLMDEEKNDEKSFGFDDVPV